MNEPEQFQHIGEVIEFLRGKTIVETVTLRNKNTEEESMCFDFSFLDYVNWSYGEKINQSLMENNGLAEIEITARQLFGKEGNKFTIGFRPQSVYFNNSSNIEDTLLLDLERYLSSKNMPYEVDHIGNH